MSRGGGRAGRACVWVWVWVGVGGWGGGAWFPAATQPAPHPRPACLPPTAASPAPHRGCRPQVLPQAVLRGRRNLRPHALGARAVLHLPQVGRWGLVVVRVWGIGFGGGGGGGVVVVEELGVGFGGGAVVTGKPPRACPRPASPLPVCTPPTCLPACLPGPTPTNLSTTATIQTWRVSARPHRQRHSAAHLLVSRAALPRGSAPTPAAAPFPAPPCLGAPQTTSSTTTTCARTPTAWRRSLWCSLVSRSSRRTPRGGWQGGEGLGWNAGNA